MNADPLVALSSRISSLAATAAASVVRVDGGHRSPSSGVAWSADVVVTTHHLLDDDAPRIGLPSGETAEAEVAGRDPSTDLAVLRVKGAALAPVTFASPDAAAVGQLVLGVSRPGRTHRASLGLLARVAPEWRAGPGGKVDRWLEATLDLVPGVSGSLVLAADGTALGVATAGLVRGAAMVVPAPTLARVVAALLAHGGVRRGYLGVATFPARLPPSLRAAAGQEGGLLVAAVEPESPAAVAGVLQGDVLLAIGGVQVAEPGDLMGALDEERIGETLPVKLVRAGEVRELPLTLGARARGGRRP